MAVPCLQTNYLFKLATMPKTAAKEAITHVASLHLRAMSEREVRRGSEKEAFSDIKETIGCSLHAAGSLAKRSVQTVRCSMHAVYIAHSANDEVCSI